ncbi:MAG TPA: MFS transporter [Lapillicoccus sp.]|jgi:MFS family permease|uniref:MFS transporter n=1 Tax=Lapillicoccus sp. TaxID=1909287 RepID=UPI002F9278E1
MPPLSQVFAVRGYLSLFIAASLSTWGDYIARLTVAAVVYDRTQSPLATATTLAVSLVPSIFGRSVLGPIADRVPYKYVLIASHVSRAAMVLVLIWAVSVEAPVPVLLVALFVLETLGGPASAAQLVLMTDLFADRRVFLRAMGLSALAEQANQALGFALGGIIVLALGPVRGLALDFATFVISAAVVALVVSARPVPGEPRPGLSGFLADLGTAAGVVTRHRVLRRLLGLSLVATLGISAPEAVALPYAGSPGFGGLLMACPIAGAAVGVVVVSRWEPHVSNGRIIAMALAMPVPLLFTAFRPPIVVTAMLWFVAGTLQAFMLPLQSTFSLVTPDNRRGAVFGLGGALSVTAAGCSYLVAGWFSELTNPASAVTMCAVICLGATVLLAARWPSGELDTAVSRAYAA